MSPVSGPRSKLSRACEHLDSLNVEFELISELHPEGVLFHIDRDGEWITVSSGPLPEPDISRLGLIFGDAVQNTRSALDYAVNALVPEPTRWTAFPIHRAESSFIDQVRGSGCEIPKRSPLLGLPRDGPAWTVIEDAQPYKRPKPKLDRIAILALLSNRDKHKALVVHHVFAEPDGLVTWPKSAVLREQRFGSEPLSFEHSTEVTRLLFADPQTDVNVTGTLALVPSFGEEQTEGAITLSVGAFRDVISRVDEILSALGFGP